MHPFMEQREIKKAILVVITSDRGMCGAFNSNLLREAEKFIKEEEAKGVKIELALIGRKGYDYFRHNNYELLHNYPGVFENLTYQKVSELADGFAASYIKHDMDALFLIYHEFESMAHQSIVIKQALPIMPVEQQEAATPADEYIFEPDSKTFLDKLAPLYLAYHLWRTLLESSASEHAARMNAMEAAAHNEAEMREKLLLSYNRARQEAVTTELLDIIGGAGALGN
jgi:F-type H+-transporting ATPase subunit gamma